MDTPPPYPAPIGWRLAAAVYDLFPVLSLLLATGALAMFATGGNLDYHSWWYFPLLVLVVAGYFVVSWRNGGQTIGMRAWRLRVVDANGTSPTYAACALRFAVAVTGISFVWCLIDRDRRAWHDIAAKTRLVRYPKPSKQR